MLRNIHDSDDAMDDMPLKGDGGGTTRVLGDIQDFSTNARQKRLRYMASALIGMGCLFLFIVYLVVHNSGPSSTQEAEEGINEVWDRFPNEVKAMIDREINPCDDFYQFSCGKWLLNADIPGEKSAIFASFSTVGDQNELVLKEIMKENLPYVQELYNTCMDTNAIDALGISPLEKTLDRIARVADKNELFQLVGEISKTGPNLFTGLVAHADAKDATKYALYASQTGLSLPEPSYYLDNARYESVKEGFQTYIVSLFTLAGVDEQSSIANARLIMDFEMELAKIFIPKEKLMDPIATYNPIVMKEIQIKYPLLFGQFLKGTDMVSMIENNPAATGITQKSTIIVETPVFFDRAEALVKSTSLLTLITFVRYNLINHFTPFLSEPFLEANFEFFSKQLGGHATRTPRWKLCQRRVSAHFPVLMGKYYAIKHFDLESQTMAQEMVQRIQKAMRTELSDHADWLDDETRKAALKKMDKVTNLIGHSLVPDSFPFLLNSTASFWNNLLVIKDYEFKKQVGRIGTTVDRQEWFMAAHQVNAYYDPSTNQIVFPAGILQPPFFDRKRHPAANYGAIGSIIGHEMTHGFDNIGRYYDGDGNLFDWWNDAVDAQFQQRSQCLVDQYNQFSIKKNGWEYDLSSPILGQVNGNFTLGENIADNGGVHVAYQAMSEYLFQRSEEEELRDPQQSLSRETVEKLFFISFAQTFCAKSTDAGMLKRLSTDPHSPERWRVNGVMMNSPDFARVFECPKGATMDPERKCRVW